MRRIMPHRIDITRLAALFQLSSHFYRHSLSLTRRGNSTETMEKRYVCPRCGQEIAAHDRNEHDDWHFAEELDRAESTPAATLDQLPPLYSAPSPTKKKQSWIQPGDSHHQSTTTSAHATKKHRHVPYVNAVDKAANLRAQTEVC